MNPVPHEYQLVPWHTGPFPIHGHYGWYSIVTGDLGNWIFFWGRIINDFLKIHDRYYYVSSLLSITLHDDSYLYVSRNHLSLGPGLFIDLIYSKGPVEFLFLNRSSTTDLIYSNFQGIVIFAKHCKIYGAQIEIYENFGEPWLNPNLEGPFCYS